jgi:hypothetical protein
MVLYLGKAYTEDGDGDKYAPNHHPLVQILPALSTLQTSSITFLN